MSNKKIIESIREYIGNLSCMSTFTNAININYLSDDDDSFSIEEVPSQPIIKKYVDGSTVRQYQFIFTSKEPYSEEILQNIDNSSFYEDFANEIEEKNNNGDLPLLEGLETKSIEVTSTPYCLKVTEDKAIYEINLNLKYFKER